MIELIELLEKILKNRESEIIEYKEEKLDIF